MRRPWGLLGEVVLLFNVDILLKVGLDDGAGGGKLGAVPGGGTEGDENGGFNGIVLIIVAIIMIIINGEIVIIIVIITFVDYHVIKIGDIRGRPSVDVLDIFTIKGIFNYSIGRQKIDGCVIKSKSFKSIRVYNSYASR
jgi:hypothetical protein